MSSRFEREESNGVVQQRWFYLTADDKSIVVEGHLTRAPDGVGLSAHIYTGDPTRPAGTRGVNGPVDGFEWSTSVGLADAYERWLLGRQDDEILWSRLELEMGSATQRLARATSAAETIRDQFPDTDVAVVAAALSKVSVGG